MRGICECGHPQHVHVGYTGGCGLCDSCADLRIPTVDGVAR